MKLIDDWKNAWKYLSVQLSGFWTFVLTAWMNLADDQKLAILDLIGVNTLSQLGVLALLSIIVGRLLKQPKLHRRRD